MKKLSLLKFLILALDVKNIGPLYWRYSVKRIKNRVVCLPAVQFAYSNRCTYIDITDIITNK